MRVTRSNNLRTNHVMRRWIVVMQRGPARKIRAQMEAKCCAHASVHVCFQQLPPSLLPSPQTRCARLKLTGLLATR